MSTPAQVSANQLNAAASTGPRTAEGKAASSQNGLRHGLSSGFKVLAHEDQSEYDALLETLREEFDPGTSHEEFLVETMAQSRWRLARINRLEAAAFDQMMLQGQAESFDACIVDSMSRKGGSALALLQRYAAAAERSYYRAHRELLQNRRAANKDRDAELDSYIKNVIYAPLPGEAERHAAKLAGRTPEFGFASQSASQDTIAAAPKQASSVPNGGSNTYSAR